MRKLVLKRKRKPSKAKVGKKNNLRIKLIHKRFIRRENKREKILKLN